MLPLRISLPQDICHGLWRNVSTAGNKTVTTCVRRVVDCVDHKSRNVANIDVFRRYWPCHSRKILSDKDTIDIGGSLPNLVWRWRQNYKGASNLPGILSVFRAHFIVQHMAGLTLG